jgi:phage FluMu gp28-like protein
MPRKKTQITKNVAEEPKKRTRRAKAEPCDNGEMTPHPAAGAATLSPRRGLEQGVSANIAKSAISAPPAAATSVEDRRHREEREICATREATPARHSERSEESLHLTGKGNYRDPSSPAAPQDDKQTPVAAPQDDRQMAGVVGNPVRLLPYQRRWVEDRSQLKLVVKARQIGYSFSATLQALLRCLERKTTWIFLSKGERQSKLLMEKVQEHIQSCGIVAQAFESTFFEETSQKQLEVRLPNGSVIYGLPSNPDTARGYSGNVTLDEFAFHADAAKIYSALFPTTTRGYSLEVISTPNGQQGKFYELTKSAGLTECAIGDLRLVNEKLPIANCQSPVAGWSSHWCDVYEAVRQGLKINIELLRAGCDDESTFQQEFCCQFVSASENFFPPELLAACLSAEATTDTPAHQLASARGNDGGGLGGRRLDGTAQELAATGQGLERNVFPASEFFLGIDIGRQHDRTVLWLDELIAAGGGNAGADGTPASAEERQSIARLVRTLDRAPFAEQLECARELLRLEKQDGQPLVRRAAVDATGIGAMLAETLAEEFGPRVEPVTFTAALKENLAFRTKRRMEKQLSLLPDTREVRRAFSAVKRVVTPSGNLRFDAVRTAAGHADEFWAKALADLAAESEPAATAADGYLVGGGPIINPRAFREVTEGWGGVF